LRGVGITFLRDEQVTHAATVTKEFFSPLVRTAIPQ
jgi:hypothetical protein